VLVLAVVLTSLPDVAYADNCSSLGDCWGYIAAAVLVTLVLGVGVFALVELMAMGELVAAAAAEGIAAGAAESVGAMAAEVAAVAVTEDMAAAAALGEIEAGVLAEAAAGGAVSAEGTITAGAAGARLGPVLQAIQSAFGASTPTNAILGMNVITRAVATLGLSPGVAAGVTSAGTIVINNVGNVTTYLFNNGQILVMRGHQVLLNLLP
jgi:hypothetical protein